VLPGTRATVADLRWLRGRGLAAALRTRAAAGQPMLGICGGYQMLGEHIDDQIESGAGQVPGPGVLPVRTRFHAGKVLARPSRQLACGNVEGYQIYYGRVQAPAESPSSPTKAAGQGPPAGPPGMACSKTTPSAVATSPKSLRRQAGASPQPPIPVSPRSGTGSSTCWLTHLLSTSTWPPSNKSSPARPCSGQH
jgi:hypothetical protein